MKKQHMIGSFAKFNAYSDDPASIPHFQDKPTPKNLHPRKTSYERINKHNAASKQH